MRLQGACKETRDMATTRVKAVAFATRDEFEAACDEIARMEVERRGLEAARDEQVNAVLAKHNPEIQQIKQDIEMLAGKADAYAKEHRDELLPAKRQSGETRLALFGFRWGNKTLALLSNRWTWDGVVASLKAAGMAAFVRTKDEVDKDAVKDQLAESVLAQHGMRVKQCETFWVEPKADVIA
jgi:phage host-nuclease inhibitor protein Gam